MQFTLITLVGVIATGVSATYNPPSSYKACGGQGLYSVPQCCATDVLGVADLNCHSPSSVPTSVSNFKDVCAHGGQRARCCVVPVAGQDVLCQTPTGLGEQ